MFITLTASFANFGKLTTIHTFLSSRFGWKLCSLAGFGIQLIITMFIFKFYDYIAAGSSHVPAEIEEEEEGLEGEKDKLEEGKGERGERGKQDRADGS